MIPNNSSSNKIFFAITFGRLTPTCIENIPTKEIAEEGDALSAMAAMVLTDPSDPLPTIVNALRFIFDGDLDNPDYSKVLN